MTHRHIFSLVLLGLIACKGDKDTGTVTDTVDTDTTIPDTADTGDTGAACTATVEDVYPINGQSGWYYRDPVTVTFNEAVDGLVSFNMLGGGASVDLAISYDDTGFKASLLPTSGTWEGSTSYNLAIEVCGEQSEYSFVTSAYGVALEDATSALVGNTYYVDMSEASYTQPAGIGTILQQFLTNPLLIDITDASDDTLSLIGAQGILDDITAEVSQDMDQATWDFGTADFSTHPYFSSSAKEIVFTYGTQDIPVHGFAFEGTFAPDAQTIGGMRFSGLGDTRYMGPLLNLGNNKNAACDLLASVGLECEACPDGEKYCLTLAGSFKDGTLQPKLDVVVVE